MLKLNQLQEHELLSLFIIREKIDNNKIQSNEFPDKAKLYEEIKTRYLKEFPNTNPSSEILETYLRNKGRYPLLNALIKRELNKLLFPQNIGEEEIDETDFFFFYNMKPLVSIMQEQSAIAMKSLMETPIKQNFQVPLSYPQLQQYTLELLEKLDSSLEYINLYQQSLADGHIIYINKEDDLKKEKIIVQLGLYQYGISISNFPMNCCLKIDKQPYLIIEQKNTLEDFPTFFHEFAHYYIKSQETNTQKISNSLSEYFSITYELYACIFLKEKGYSKDILRKMMQIRNQNTYTIGEKLSDLFSYMSIYIEKGTITEEEEITRYKHLVDVQRKSFTKEYLEELKGKQKEALNPILLAHISCDLCIEELIQKEDWYYSYPYILGQSLATKTIECIEKKIMSITELKNMMEKATTLNPTFVFTKLGYDIEKENQERNNFIPNREKQSIKRKRK